MPFQQVQNKTWLVTAGVVAVSSVILLVLLKKALKKGAPKTLVDPNVKVSLKLIEREVSPRQPPKNVFSVHKYKLNYVIAGT